MKDRVAIVTGGSRGIGRAIAVALASEGCKVVINYGGNEIAARQTEALCKEKGGEVLLFKGDVSKAEVCNQLVKETLDTFGKVDILVNNAGIVRDNLLMSMSEEDFDKVIATNLKGCFLMMKAVSRFMIKKRYGRIINISSISGILGNGGQANYAASKGGVISMTKSFAREIAKKGITVNAVAPGFIKTDMTDALGENAAAKLKESIPQGEIGKPEDVANGVKFFAKEESKYITGQVLCVDGGMCMC